MIGSKESWTDKNSLRDYPLIVNSGNFPSELIVDACVCLWTNTPVIPYVTLTNIGPNMVSVVFSDADSGTDLFAAIGIAGTENTVEVVAAGDIDVTGYIKFGKSQNSTKVTQRYDLGSVTLVDHCFVNFGDHVVLSARTQGVDSEILGDLTLVTTGDFSITPTTSEVATLGQETILEITLNNAQRYKELCSPPSTVCECKNQPIKQINSVLPDVSQNITIESTDDILQIISEAIGITISALATSTNACEPTNLPLEGGKLRGEE